MTKTKYGANIKRITMVILNYDIYMILGYIVI